MKSMTKKLQNEYKIFKQTSCVDETMEEMEEMSVVVIKPHISKEQRQEMDKKGEKALYDKQMVAKAYPNYTSLQIVLRNSKSKIISNPSYFCL